MFIKISIGSATRGVLSEKVFLEVSQNSQKNTCARVAFLIKFQASGISERPQLYHALI